MLDGTVVRVPKTYPAYFGTYEQLRQAARRTSTDSTNLFLVGRNGMHRYNNQDHSMLTAMTAVDNIVNGRRDKSNIWEVNTEADYHEEKTERPARSRGVGRRARGNGFAIAEQLGHRPIPAALSKSLEQRDLCRIDLRGAPLRP